jgi:hypothetical protein
LEQAFHNRLFHWNPEDDPLLHADHGGVHPGDVARQILHVRDMACGLLIPLRVPGGQSS